MLKSGGNNAILLVTLNAGNYKTKVKTDNSLQPTPGKIININAENIPKHIKVEKKAHIDSMIRAIDRRRQQSAIRPASKVTKNSILKI